MSDKKSVIKEIEGCTVVYGDLPLSQMAEVLGAAGDGFVDPNAARVLGATMVVGTQANINKLKASESFKASAIQTAKKESQGADLSEDAVKWLIMGERGSSSSFMFGYLAQIDVLKGSGCPIPRDAADMRRCRLLIEQVPEFKEHLHKLAGASDEWALLIERWNEICQVMDAESPEWRDARGRSAGTSKMLRQVREDANGAS